MIPLPKWIKEIFDKGECPHCRKGLQRKGVFGIGIREERIKKKKIYSFCYEYKCPLCEQRTVFTGFPTTFDDFISDLLDVSDIFPESAKEVDPEDEDAEVTEETEIEVQPMPKKKKSGMTDREAKEGIRLIKETEFHEDLLDKLGIKKLEREPKEDEDK